MSDKRRVELSIIDNNDGTFDIWQDHSLIHSNAKFHNVLSEIIENLLFFKENK